MEPRLRQAIHKGCGGVVTSEWKDYTTYACVFVNDQKIPSCWDDSSRYIGDSDKNETGFYCSVCNRYVDETEVEPGDEYVSPDDKQDALISDIVRTLRGYMIELEDEGYAGNSESDAAAEYVSSLITRLGDVFGIFPELTEDFDE